MVFVRLIWKESRFDPNAVSPVGAEGIAQFMPGTARLRRLENPFDIEQAIPASAKYLGELKTGFGNLGLAAAAYNAGENRVSRWLSSGGYLPLETENYVLDIMGEPADNFSDRTYAGTVHPLHPTNSVREACRALPVTLLMVTHDLPYAAELCPRSVILDGGRIVADAPTADLLSDEALLTAHRLELPYGFAPARPGSRPT